jgi:hypothetical protein
VAQARHSPQTISWFWDLYQRQLLNLDPPYQRRSVWNTAFREYFIDTLLLEYPAPAIFLFSEVEPSGKTMHSVVDGKQRLLTTFSASRQPDSSGTCTYHRELTRRNRSLPCLSRFKSDRPSSTHGLRPRTVWSISQHVWTGGDCGWQHSLRRQ